MSKVRISIGSAVIETGKPSLIVSIFDVDGLSLLRTFSSGARKTDVLYEVRYDLFTQRSPDALKHMVRKLLEMKIDFVFTFRTSDQAEAKAYYGAAVEAGCPAVDLDYTLLGSGITVPSGVAVIASMHLGPGESLGKSLETLERAPADLIKIAAWYQESDPFIRDMALVSEFKSRQGRPMAFIPMGKGSEFMRLVSACLISDLNYVHDGQPTAVGQPELEEFRADLSRFFTRR